MTGYNHVTLVGTLSERGVELRPIESTGTMLATCRLCVPEESATGQVFHLWVPVHGYGKARDVLQVCEPGEALLLDGKLKWHSWQDKEGKRQGQLVVVALAMATSRSPTRRDPLTCTTWSSKTTKNKSLIFLTCS